MNFADEPLNYALAAVFYGVALVLSLGICLLAPHGLPWTADIFRPAGLILILIGIALFGWAFAHIRLGITGVGAPRTDHLVCGGPYAIVRHPIYLAALLAFVGFAFFRGSLVGLLAVLILFVPSAVWRARQEDRALQERFREEWSEYAARTGFFWPRRP